MGDVSAQRESDINEVWSLERQFWELMEYADNGHIVYCSTRDIGA